MAKYSYEFKQKVVQECAIPVKIDTKKLQKTK